MAKLKMFVVDLEYYGIYYQAVKSISIAVLAANELDAEDKAFEVLQAGHTHWNTVKVTEQTGG